MSQNLLVQLLLAAACSGTAGLLLPAHQTTRPLVKPASTCARISSSPLLKVRVCLKALLRRRGKRRSLMNMMCLAARALRLL